MCNTTGKKKASLSISEEMDLKKKKRKKGLKKSANTVDVDVDAGIFGVAGGQVAMRVNYNTKCAGCLKYDHDQSACTVGLVPDVCGDGSYPDIGYAPAAPDRIAAKNWTNRKKGAVAESASATSASISDSVDGTKLAKHRIEVLGDSALALSVTGEKMLSLAKAATRGMGVADFAEMLGTSVEVVRSLARRLGDKQSFLQFVKSRLPEIRQSYGLTSGQIEEVFASASGVVRSLSPNEWTLWKGANFATSAEVTDEALARSIAENGLMDANAIFDQGVVTSAEPRSELPEAEPISTMKSEPIDPGIGFVGGNLHLADDLSRYGR